MTLSSKPYLIKLKLMNQKGAVHLLLPTVVLVVAAVLISANIQTSQRFNDQSVQGVLTEKGGSGTSNPGSGNENKGGPSAEVRLKQEVRTSDERIKTEIKEDRIRVDIRQENTKTKIQQRGNEFLIETKIESDDKSEAIEAGEDEATKSADEDEGELIQNLRAISKFPLRIDTSTNQLIMTKNGIERVLTVLPAKAVQNMLRAHLKKGLGPKFFQTATSSAEPSATASAEPSTPSASPPQQPVATEFAELTILEDQITLEEVDSQVVYKIPAKKHLRVFGFIPISTDLTDFVSAESGVLLKTKESLLARILDLLSP